jgi:F0F1-type ATP synthase assembly protein I
MAASSQGGMGKYLGLALMLPIATCVGYALGYGLDKLFHTTWIRWPFLAFGTVAGILDLIYELDKDK